MQNVLIDIQQLAEANNFCLWKNNWNLSDAFKIAHFNWNVWQHVLLLSDEKLH